MKYISIAILLITAFIVSGCTTADIVEGRQLIKEEISERVHQKRLWADRKRELHNEMVDGLMAQAGELMKSGQNEEALKLFERAAELHEQAKPKFLVERYLEGGRQTSCQAIDPPED